MVERRAEKRSLGIPIRKRTKAEKSLHREYVDPILAEIALRIRTERERQQMSAEELGKRAGLSPATVVVIEKGRGPTVRSLLTIAKGLRVSASYLLGLDAEGVVRESADPLRSFQTPMPPHGPPGPTQADLADRVARLEQVFIERSLSELRAENQKGATQADGARGKFPRRA